MRRPPGLFRSRADKGQFIAFLDPRLDFFNQRRQFAGLLMSGRRARPESEIAVHVKTVLNVQNLTVGAADIAPKGPAPRDRPSNRIRRKRLAIGAQLLAAQIVSCRAPERTGPRCGPSAENGRGCFQFAPGPGPWPTDHPESEAPAAGQNQKKLERGKSSVGSDSLPA